MRPCDCKSKVDEMELSEQGMSMKTDSIDLNYGSVILTVGPCRLRVTSTFMKRISEWYLEDQDE
jgi:hypothetical protein